MPAKEVYSIDFAGGTWQPSLDANGWGAMQSGGTIAGSTLGSHTAIFEQGGLWLTAERPLDATDDGIHNSVYVVPQAPAERAVKSVLPLESRLFMSVAFDLPDAVAAGPNVKAAPWAVCLRIKFAHDSVQPPEDDFTDGPWINVTCQFNNTNDHNGVRLNDPDHAQDSKDNDAPDLDFPLSYGRYKSGCLGFWKPPLFVLSFAFSGIQAGPVPNGPRKLGDPLGYAVGCGYLEILGLRGYQNFRFFKYDLKDHRLFSSTALSSVVHDWIGALGVGITSTRGQGTFKVRLRRFSISQLTGHAPLDVPG